MVPNYQPRNFSKDTAEIMGVICKNTQDRLYSDQFGIDIQEPEVAFTIATVFLEEVFRELALRAQRNGGEAKVELFKLLTIGVDLRESDSAEKDGNYTVFLEAGPAAKTLIKNDSATEQK